MTKAPPQIPNYHVLEKLGEGGMATVWLAQRDHDHRISVVKVLHEHLSGDHVVRSRFLREAQVASLLDHANIARLYDAGRAGESSYLAMEFIAGTDVETMMMKLATRKQMLPPELSITVTLRVLEGLHYAHDFRDAEGRHLEIVHRDLSPRNVMLTFDGDVKIIDFGLVRTNLGDFRTAPGMIAGTLRYMSPEQATAEPIDRRSDIYTWSVVLYELLSGRQLINAGEARAILGAVVVDVPPPLSSRNPNLPRALDAVLAKALEKDRENRFKTALEMRDALALAAGTLGTASAKSIGDFAGDLFPSERIQATERMKSVDFAVTEGPAFESTRVAQSAEIPLAEPTIEVPPQSFEPTVAERPSPLPPRRRPRSKLPAILAATAAIAICVAVVFTQPKQVETLPVEPPPAPPAAQQIVVAPSLTEDPPPVQKQPKPFRVAKAPAKTKEQVLEPQPPPPPIDEKTASPVQMIESFKTETGLDEARLKKLFRECGLDTVMYAPTESTVREAIEACRRKLPQIRGTL